MLELTLRRQELQRDEGGHAVWQAIESPLRLAPEKACLLLCDAWDDHWCRGAVERMAHLVPRWNRVIAAARRRGVQIIHSPTEVVEFYAGTAARERMRTAPRLELPAPREIVDAPLPIDDSDGGCDTGERTPRRAWSRQHAGIEIDMEHDGISDDEAEIHSFVRRQGIELVLLMGVHANMCVLNRPFGIKRWVRRGVPVAFVRDLTDAMYNPAMPPYASHAAGTQLVVEYVEKFWCPTATSGEVCGEPS